MKGPLKENENGCHERQEMENVLRATTACTFSTSQLPKVARTPKGIAINLGSIAINLGLNF